MKKERTQRIYKTIMLVALTAFITFIITAFSIYTYLEEKSNITSNSSSIIKELSNNSDLQSYLKRIKATIDNYYLWKDKIDDQKLQDGAIQGYVAGLKDEYTEYIPKDKMKDFKESITGNFVGIGIYMTKDENQKRVAVHYPIPDSPAEKVGIQAGDLIINVDGKEYTSDDYETIADNIKGEEGTKVNIEVERNGERLTFDITREKINTNPITTKLIENNIGYLRLPSFDENTSQDFKTKVEELQKQGAKSLIIDLRNNGGGIVDEATQISDFILEKDKIIMSTVDNKENKQETKSENNPIFKFPIVILVNENTASASEILACSLQDNEAAKIVGTKTFGKGVIQVLLSLDDGSGLKITTEEYYTPKGTKIHKAGIKPDEEVKLPETVKNIYSVKEEEDTQLKKAIEILK